MASAPDQPGILSGPRLWRVVTAMLALVLVIEALQVAALAGHVPVRLLALAGVDLVIASLLVPGVLILLLRRSARIEAQNRALQGAIDSFQKSAGSLKEREATYRSLVENVEKIHFIYIHDTAGVFTYVSPSIERILGYTPEEFCRHYSTYLTDHPVNAEVTRHTDLSIEGIKQPPYLVQIYHRDGSKRWLEVSEVPIKDASQVTVGVQGIAHDVTERRNAEDELRESEQRFKELSESLPLTIFETDRDGFVTYLNQAGKSLFGVPDAKLGKIQPVDYVVPAERERAARNLRARVTGGFRGAHEYTALKADGTTFPMATQSVPVVRGDGTVGLRGIIIDLTERKQLEAERLRSQKLESVGVLAGGIAHDFNNILTAILGNVSLARMQLPQGAPLAELLESCEKAGLHARELTQQLLTFARGGAPVKKILDIGALAREAATFAARGSAVHAVIDVADGLWMVEADGGQLRQVISNLVLNACQALGDRGTVKVSLTNTCLNDGKGSLPSGRCVRIAVQDQGAGIAPEHLSRIFDPYFTTKKGGTGLGLAVSYSVVHSHGGSIEVQSRVGEGSTFVVMLPACQGQPEHGVELTEAAQPGSGRVLVMDDEPLVRETAEGILRHLGYEVVLTSNGEEAIAAYARALAAGTRFDLVIMDLTVPGGMGGKEALRELLALDHAVCAIVSSGYSADSVMADARAHGFRGVATKPYRVQELASVLRAVLSRPE